MSQTTEYYEKLLQKYLDGLCNAAETEELYTWLQSSDSRRPLLNNLQQEFEKVLSSRHEMPVEISDRMETRLLQQISHNYVVSISGKLVRRWTIAAAIAGLLLAGGIFYYNQPRQIPSTPAQSPAAVAVATVAPGTNKAVLTLANGDVVTLDSTGNQIITQGNSTVRQKNGQLQYAANGDVSQVVYNTLTVPRGGQFNIVLPDGTHVWLNAASSLRYPTSFNGKERIVEIQGQGYFEVMKNEKQPFVVKVKDMEVQVMGTAFDVMAYEDEKNYNTTLINGAVNVKHGNNEQRLKPGLQAVLNIATGDMNIRPVDVDQVIAWKTGFFEFDNARLTDIMKQISRWYDIDVNYDQPENDRLYGGRISRNLPLSEILHMLEANGPKFTLSGKKLTVTSVK